MPNYTTANLVKAQTIMTQMFNNGEVRFREPVTHKEFVRNTEIMIPSHKQVRTREDRAVDVNYWARSARALGTGGRIHNHTGTKGDSAVLAPTWTTYDDPYVFSLKQADISVYSLEQQLANELGQIVANFAEGLETVAATYLFSNRSGVNVATSEGSFNGTNDVFEVTESTNGDRAVQITKSTMDINKYQGNYTVFCDSIAFNKFEKQANQGSGNSENLSFQFSGANFIKSIDLDSQASGLGYTNGFWIAVQEGLISVLDWIPMQNRMGVSTKENEYASLLNPVDSLVYAVHKYEERFDGTATNGYTQDLKTEVEVSIDLSYQAAPLTTANETTLQAFALV